MLAQGSKTLLKNIIRHTDTHNRMLEEAEMWRQNKGNVDTRHNGPYMDKQEKKTPLPPTWNINEHDDRDRPHQSTYWSRQLQKAETADPGRWGHGGYEELYPEEFVSSDDDRLGASRNDLRRKLSKSKKTKKAKKKKKRKRKKKQKWDDSNSSSSESDSESESEDNEELPCGCGATNTKKNKTGPLQHSKQCRNGLSKTKTRSKHRRKHKRKRKYQDSSLSESESDESVSYRRIKRRRRRSRSESPETVWVEKNISSSL